MNNFLIKSLPTNKILSNILPLNHLYENNYLTNYSNIFSVIKFLKQNFIKKYEILSNLTGYEISQKKIWYAIIYNLTSITQNETINIKLLIEEQQSLESISVIYFNAN
jgi:NADH:ubiquinone oxidoreductase subunit C